MLNPGLTADGTRLTTPDLRFDDVALAVMLHSEAHPPLGKHRHRPVESDGDLVAAGVTVLGIALTITQRTPTVALRRVEQAHAAAVPPPPHRGRHPPLTSRHPT